MWHRASAVAALLSTAWILSPSRSSAQEAAPDAGDSIRDAAPAEPADSDAALPTLGGLQFWADEVVFRDWRIQRHCETGHCRLLDPLDKRHASGTLDECRERLEAIKRGQRLEPWHGRYVVLLHGLVRSRASMDSIGAFLREEGTLQVVNVGYPSTRGELAQHAASLASVIEHLEGAERIDFVAHSLGNLVLRHYLGDLDRTAGAKRPPPGRIVMLAPPNRGAELAEMWQGNKLFGVLLGRSAAQLAEGLPSLAERLATPACEFGIIAGGRGDELGWNPVLPGDDDGTVSVASTRLPGAADFILLPVNHRTIMTDAAVKSAILSFLSHGYFESETERRPIADDAADAPPRRTRVGVRGRVGCLESPRVVRRMAIDEPGVYENYLVDGEWSDRQLVEITADGVTLRHCEIANGRNNGVVVEAADVVIESCRIHHLLAGTFTLQDDAHGITGRPRRLTIKNCEVFQVSGDAAQFDPDRGEWDDVTIENCTFWTAPLDADAAGFQRGERPGENGVDTKQIAKNPRSRLTIRNCVFYGWGRGQITNQAALNIKENVASRIENCVFYDNDICFRLRGAMGEPGGARVTIEDCDVYRSQIALRLEEEIEDLTIRRLGFGAGIKRRRDDAAGGPGPGFEYADERDAVPLDERLGK